MNACGSVQQAQVKRLVGAETAGERLKDPQSSFGRCALLLSLCIPPSIQCRPGSWEALDKFSLTGTLCNITSHLWPQRGEKGQHGEVKPAAQWPTLLSTRGEKLKPERWPSAQRPSSNVAQSMVPSRLKTQVSWYPGRQQVASWSPVVWRPLGCHNRGN